MRHPSCILFYGVTFDEHEVPYLIMEFCEKGSVLDMMEKEDAKLRSWTFLLSLFHDIARGFRFIHSSGIIHRDIKPANIMVNFCSYSC